VKRTWLPLLLLAGLVVGLPLLGKWLRRHAEPRCAMHGVAIHPLYRVRIEDSAGASHAFCCIRCAQSWLARRGERPAAIEVTDETTGEPIDARLAHFVESAIVTNPVTGNRIHAFRDQADAEAHSRTFAGHILTSGDYPFMDFLPDR
jgi:hypothetical protein